MCIAVPMEVIEIDDGEQSGRALFAGNEMNVSLALLTEPKVGDYVLVHAGCAVEKVRKETAEEILSIFGELEESWKDI